MRDLRKEFERNRATALLLFFFRLQCIYTSAADQWHDNCVSRCPPRPLIIVNEKIYLAYFKSKILIALHLV